MPHLPTLPDPGELNLRDFTWLIYGLPKVGKTTFAAQWPDPLFLRTEQGTKGLKVYATDIPNWNTAEEILDELDSTASKSKFKTIVIDVLENLYEILCDAICEENKVQAIADLKYGKGYALVNRALVGWLNDLHMMGYCVVLVSHTREVRDDTGAVEVNRLVPNLSEGIRGRIIGWVDMTLYIKLDRVRDTSKKGAESEIDPLAVDRFAVTCPTPALEAGGRIVGMSPRIQISPDPAKGFSLLEKEFSQAASKQLSQLTSSTSRARKRK